MDFTGLTEKIREYDVITLYRHEHPDCDALGSQYAMKTWLEHNFPGKMILALGAETTDQAAFPASDEADDETIRRSLAIVLDTSGLDRVDDHRCKDAAYMIKIDHHPNLNPYGDQMYVFTEAAAACEILAEYFRECEGTEVTAETAEYLYKGLLTDTLCFRTSNTTPHTLETAAYLASFGIRIPEINRELFDLDLKTFEVCSKLRSRMQIIDGVIGYIVVSEEDEREYGLTGPEVRNHIDEIGHIRELQIWCIFTAKQLNGETVYDGSLRSKTATINTVANKYNGGGHKNASGVKNLKENDIPAILQDLKNVLIKEQIL